MASAECLTTNKNLYSVIKSNKHRTEVPKPNIFYISFNFARVGFYPHLHLFDAVPEILRKNIYSRA